MRERAKQTLAALPEQMLLGLKSLMYLSVILALACFTRLELQVTTDEHQTAQKLQATLGEVAQTSQMIRGSVAPLPKTIEEAQKTLHAYRGLADTVRKATLDERDAIQEFNDAGVKAAKDLDSQIANLKTAEITDAFLRTADRAQETLQSSSKAMDAAAGILADPKLQATLSDMAGSAAEVHGIVSDAHQVTSHYRQQILAPVSKAKALLTFGKDVVAGALANLIP